MSLPDFSNHLSNSRNSNTRNSFGTDNRPSNTRNSFGTDNRPSNTRTSFGTEPGPVTSNSNTRTSNTRTSNTRTSAEPDTRTSAGPKPKPFNLLFIRHGISCANLRKERSKTIKPINYLTGKASPNDHTKIVDPGLTRGGILKAVARGELLQKVLTDSEPLVCASTLVRAQQTALYMLDPLITPTNKLHILPYMSEVGLFKTPDNTPRPLSAQLDFLREQGITDINARIDTSNLDGKPDANTPNLEKFKTFLGKFLETEEAGRTVILFTHGNFIAKLLKSLDYKITKNDRPNYVAYQIEGTLEGDKLTMALPKEEEYTYAPDGLNTQTGDDYRFKYSQLRTLRADIECRLEEQQGACEMDVCSVKMSPKKSGGRRRRVTRKRRQR